MNILIVDDKPENLYMLETLLKGSGYDVVTAENGVEALEKLKKESIDLIISDVLMPRMDGFQLCRECKTDDILEKIPFIFYTATYTDPRDEEFALSLGAERFVIKPVEPDVFLKILESIIQDYMKGSFAAVPPRTIQEEAAYLAEYNNRLIGKLDKKLQDLERTNKELKESKETLRIRNQINNIFLTYPDDKMYAEVLQVIQKVMGSDYGTFGYFDEEGSFVAPSVTREIYWEKCNVPQKDIIFKKGTFGGIFGRAIKERKTLLDNDGPFNTPEGHIHIKNTMVTPIIFRDEMISAIHIANKKDGYHEKDRMMLETIAEHIAPVLNARLQRDKQGRERRQAEVFTKNILESVGEGFSVIDRDYRLVLANRAFGCQSKLQVEDITGKHCYEISHGTGVPCYENGEECPTRYTFETGLPRTVIHTHRDRDGNTIYVEVRSYPMKDESGNVVSVIEVTSDITEKRKLEDQLRQAQKMEAIGQLAGGIAHDFNNILTAIIGYSNLLQMSMSEDDPLRTDLDQILSSSHRAAHLTQSLLAFSRQQIINPKPVKLNEIVQRVEKFLSRLIGEDVELKTALIDKELTIIADSGQIEQILMNLATNARDAMPEGGTLTVGTELVNLDEMFIETNAYDVKPGMYALISVADTGEGMDNNTSKKIFEPFFTTKELGRGTGLGLSIIYGIVRQHNGIVNVYSELGKGTAFKIYLPVIEAGIEETKEENLPPPKGGTETVLLAEDDEAVRKLIRTVLGKFGYKVIEAVDGEDAIIRFKENSDKIDLVILDVIMPKKDGKTAYEEIKKVRPEIKAIFASGYTTDIIDRKGILEEGVNLLRKPISPNELLKKVREVLDA